MNVLPFLILLSTFCPKNDDSVSLSIQFDNIQKEHIGKKMYVGYWINQNQDFPDDKDKVDFGQVVTVNASTQKVTKQLQKDEYAISAFIDLNGNEKLDTNLFGMPKEPFCFSKNFIPKLSAPDFNDCSFQLDGDKTINIKMIN